MRKNKPIALLLALCMAIASMPVAKAADAADTLDGTLYIFDLKAFLGSLPDAAARYDYCKLATALQGLVNREKPQIYFLYESTSFNEQQGFDVDAFWLAQLSAGGKYLSACVKNDSAYPPTLAGFYALLNDFSAFREGFTLWDNDVPATANVASTAAGVESLLPVRSASGLYDALFVEEPARFGLAEIKLDLTGKFTGLPGKIWGTDEPSTGSAKNDAYLWAKAKYLDTGLTNPLRMAYCTDAWITTFSPMFWTTLANADFHIARKAFFWDLSPDDRIAPIDDRGQPVGTDVATLNKLLFAQARQSGFNIFTVSGFVPWNFKYTSTSDPAMSQMGDVESEWTMINRISAYGGQTEADANAGVGDISNCSLFMHVPLNGELRQSNSKGAEDTRALSRRDLCKQKIREWFYSCDCIAGSSFFTWLLGPLNPGKHYVSIYMGDYDSASWTSGILPMLWESSKGERGKYPLCWPIGAGLSERIPQLFNYLYENATPGDYFVAGNNGTAYLNATLFEEALRPAGMPDMLPKWEAYNIAYNQRFDLRIQGFYINTDRATRSMDDLPRRVMEAYSRMTPVGVNVQAKNAFPGGVARVANPDDGAVTPFINYRDIGGAGSTAQQLADAIYDVVNRAGGGQRASQFHMLRCILIPPGVINEALDLLAAGRLSGNRCAQNLCCEVVDPYTLFRLAGEG